ncbi:MAG: hypothetical protein M1481_03075 [Candidatus Thermoplasmatota archaeon]|jgi:hypothetical protein|nr:hypothetical protein [Candidatus Thermoplasmatota archaeon]MCL5964039.1 hypothetical protein [Candidatus Thermoplasmatota archaeon]
MEDDKTKKVLLISIISFIIILSFSGIIANNVQAKVYPEVTVIVSGPTLTAINQSYFYNITVAGGPATDGGIYQYHAYLVGKNISAIAVAPANSSSKSGKFVVNITMPAIAQTVTLVVTGNSTLGNITKNSTEKIPINVIKPLLIHSIIYNRGLITLDNVTVEFYLDGTFIGSSLVPSILPFTNASVFFNYTVASLPTGYHTVKVVVNNTMIVFSNGKNYETITFYVPGPPPNYTLIYELTAVSVTVAIVLIIILYMGSKKKKKPVKKW